MFTKRNAGNQTCLRYSATVASFLGISVNHNIKISSHIFFFLIVTWITWLQTLIDNRQAKSDLWNPSYLYTQIKPGLWKFEQYLQGHWRYSWVVWPTGLCQVVSRTSPCVHGQPIWLSDHMTGLQWCQRDFCVQMNNAFNVMTLFYNSYPLTSQQLFEADPPPWFASESELLYIVGSGL